MREIKFRIWNPKINAFSYWKWFEKNGYLEELKTRNIEYYVMQYTGVKDRNGKEIYEGDIVLDPVGKKRKGTVEYGNLGAYEVYYHKQKGFIGDAIQFQGVNEGNIVIGNIYEHSHLLNN